jgi:hypothetical protein
MQRCRTFFCASLLHAALSYFLRFAASCSVVVLSALRCFMQRCRTLCASLLHAVLSYSLRFAAHAALSFFLLRFAVYAALSYFLRFFAASCSVVVLSTLRCLMQRCRTVFCASLLHAALSYSLLSALRSLMQRSRCFIMQRCSIIYLEFCLD